MQLPNEEGDIHIIEHLVHYDYALRSQSCLFCNPYIPSLLVYIHTYMYLHHLQNDCNTLAGSAALLHLQVPIQASFSHLKASLKHLHASSVSLPHIHASSVSLPLIYASLVSLPHLYTSSDVFPNPPNRFLFPVALHPPSPTDSFPVMLISTSSHSSLPQSNIFPIGLTTLYTLYTHYHHNIFACAACRHLLVYMYSVLPRRESGGKL